MSGDLIGKVAIVTGGVNGIGRASVELFVQHGAKVVIADIQADTGEDLAASLGDQVAFCRTDVTQETDWERLVARTVDRFGGLDVLFNNAGGGGIVDVPYTERNFADFQPTIALNLLGPMLGMKHAGRYMIDQGRGSIVNCCSTGGFFPGIGIPFYRAAKAGLLQISSSLALEFSPHGVRVNCISPGPIATDDFAKKMGLDGEAARHLQERVTAGLLSMQALKEPIRPIDIAEGALYLASDRSRRVTGHNLVVAAGNGLGDLVNRAAEMAQIIRTPQD
jgi:NAD(P)-dependent dehydrogenase (short-subunit alcohol dehydrogenase family)